jgi:NADH-quinone oxidoreductase subunit G
MRHPHFSELRLLAAELARLTGAAMGYLPEGANSAGLSQAGVLPHRGVGGEAIAKPGATAAEICQRPPRGLFLLGVEPELDCANGAKAVAAMERAEFVLALSSFLSDSLNRDATVILPIGTFAETSGTFVNAAGKWQSFGSVAQPVGQSRPAWKILRVLGNMLDLPDCDYESSEAVRDELQRRVADALPDNSLALEAAPEGEPSETASPDELDVPIYRIDPLVRRARSLQFTRDGQAGQIPPGEDRKIA